MGGRESEAGSLVTVSSSALVPVGRASGSLAPGSPYDVDDME